MNNKKGVMLSVNMIIIIVLALIALVIAIVFMQTQMTKGAKKYGEITEELDKCESFLGKRKCVPRTECPPREIVWPIGKGWADCEPPNVCCEV